MEGIEVRLRDENDTEGKHLCSIRFDELDALISEMRRWGVFAGSEDGATDNLYGQFVLADQAYFEIVVGDD